MATIPDGHVCGLGDPALRLLFELDDFGLTLLLDADNGFRLRGPAEAKTPEILGLLKSHRYEMIHHLRHTGFCHECGLCWSHEVEEPNKNRRPGARSAIMTAPPSEPEAEQLPLEEIK